MNFQQNACSIDLPCVLAPRNGVGRYLFHISRCNKLAEGIWRPSVVKRELADFTTEDEQFLSQRFFLFSNLLASRTGQGASNHCQEHGGSAWVIHASHSAETPTKERVRVTILHVLPLPHSRRKIAITLCAYELPLVIAPELV